MSNLDLVNNAMSLLQIHQDFRFYAKGEINDYELYNWTQEFSDTSLGFGGIAGQAVTSARVFVFIPLYVKDDCLVFVNSKFAYKVPYNDKFKADVYRQCVKDKIHANTYKEVK